MIYTLSLAAFGSPPIDDFERCNEGSAAACVAAAQTSIAMGWEPWRAAPLWIAACEGGRDEGCAALLRLDEQRASTQEATDKRFIRACSKGSRLACELMAQLAVPYLFRDLSPELCLEGFSDSCDPFWLGEPVHGLVSKITLLMDDYPSGEPIVWNDGLWSVNRSAITSIPFDGARHVLLATIGEVKTINGHHMSECGYFSGGLAMRDGQILSGCDPTQAWDVEHGKMIPRGESPDETPHHVLHRDPQRIITQKVDGFEARNPEDPSALIWAISMGGPSLAISPSGALSIERRGSIRGAHAAMSPDGSLLALAGYGFLLLIEPVGGKVLYSGPGRSSTLRWTADGDLLVFYYNLVLRYSVGLSGQSRPDMPPLAFPSGWRGTTATVRRLLRVEGARDPYTVFVSTLFGGVEVPVNANGSYLLQANPYVQRLSFGLSLNGQTYYQGWEPGSDEMKVALVQTPIHIEGCAGAGQEVRVWEYPQFPSSPVLPWEPIQRFPPRRLYSEQARQLPPSHTVHTDEACLVVLPLMPKGVSLQLGIGDRYTDYIESGSNLLHPAFLQQGKTFSGQLVGEDGLPLIGATLSCNYLVDGKTDLAGRFIFSTPEEAVILFVDEEGKSAVTYAVHAGDNGVLSKRPSP